MSSPITHILTFAGAESYDMSEGSTESDTIEVGFSKSLSIQCIFTDSVNGLLEIQSSLDNSNWASDLNTRVIFGGADNVVFNLQDSSVPYYRVKFLYGNGTGTLTGRFYRKPQSK